MKLKKFNTIVAAGLLGGSLVVWNAAGFLAKNLPWARGPAEPAALEMQEGAALQSEAADAFSPVGKQVLTVPWQSHLGQLPGEATLKKWTLGDRTYYEIAGPIHSGYRDGEVTDHQHWGNYFACEVFFDRGGGAYDQWIINPAGSAVFHWNTPAGAPVGRTHHLADESRLPGSRYRAKVQGDRVYIAFWCHNRDTPTNIVFNYNEPSGDKLGGLAWVTTGTHKEGQPWNHHLAEWWTDP